MVGLLHSFVLPNAGWIGILVATAEFAIGLALIVGFFTRIAALGSPLLLFTYVMSGTASVCAFYALVAIVVLTMLVEDLAAVLASRGLTAADVAAFVLVSSEGQPLSPR